MSYEVVVAELRASARKFHTVEDSTAGYVFPESQCVAPAAVGHLELADWILAVVEQCGKAGTALHDGAHTLAEGLETQATDYETTDQAVHDRFQCR
jgi:hypothetical protein